MSMALVTLLCALAEDESKLRAEFAQAFKAKETAKRVEALKKLEGAKEEKTVEAVAGGLKDPEKDVKKAAAEVLATCQDGAGAAIKPLCASLVNKTEDPDVRYACAQALAKAPYKTEAVAAMIDTISGIENKDRHLHVFGKNVTVVLEGVTKESFDYGKNTPHLWQEWWKENKPKYEKADETKRAEHKKSK
jgi:hypothetical protein